MTTPPAPVPDDKDWTWVLSRPCPDCGYDAAGVERDEIPVRILESVLALTDFLMIGDPSARPAPEVWSPVEYACHVRDVCLIFLERLQLVLAQDDPQFANWDQDAAAIQGRYWAQPLGELGAELLSAANDVSEAFAAVPGDAWLRPGRRSNGSVFTVDTLGRYFLHDLVHHAWDVATAG